MYTGRNRNYTDITEDALNKVISRKGYANIPVIAHLYKGNDGKLRVGGHDMDIVLKADGGIDYVDLTVPFGVVPEDCNPCFEDVTEKSGEVKRYFCVDVILWTHRYDIMDAAAGDEIYFNQSMEINVNHCYYDRDDYCVIGDFDFSALCLLNRDTYDKGKNVEPCFPSAGVSKFDLSEMKNEFDSMYSEMKKCGIIKGECNLNTEQIKNKLDGKYSMLFCAADTVTALNKENFEVFEIPFTVDAEKSEVVFAYDKAVRKYLAVSDTDSGVELVVKEFAVEIGKALAAKAEAEFTDKTEAIKAEITKGFIEKLDERNAEFTALQNEYSVVKSKLDEYEAAEIKAREDAHKAEIDRVIASYSEKLDKNTDYFLYKTRVDYSKSADEVRQDMLIILGKSVMEAPPVKASFAAWGTQNAVPKHGGGSDKYGDLLENIDN